VSNTKNTPCPLYSITAVYLETLEQSIRDVSTPGDNDCLDQMRARVFKRSDFLRFDVPSIGSRGNDTLFQMLNPAETNKPCNLPGDMEMEFWDQWKQYPNFDEFQDLTTGKALALLAWLCQTFGLRLYYSRLSESDKKSVLKKDKEDNILDHLTLDDFVFLFVQVENNINKWNLMYSAWKRKHIEGWTENESLQSCECDKRISKDDLERIKVMNRCGYEFPNGAGVAGKDGTSRYNAMTKYLYKAYFKNHEDSGDSVLRNRKALDQAIKELVETSRAAKRANGENLDDVTTSNGKNLPELSSRDEVLDAIQASMWAGAMESLFSDSQNSMHCPV
jgi:hypothetical protein